MAEIHSTAAHEQHAHGAARPGRRFGIALALTVLILVVEITVGILANSLALLSDAGHVVTDVFALGLGWFAAIQATRPANARNTWGYHRVGIISALANATTLILITGFILFDAIARLEHPQQVSPPLMVAAALFAIIVNLVVAKILGDAHGHAHDTDLNTRAAMLHVLTDIGDSAGVVLGALIIAVTGFLAIDSLISIVIAILLALSAVRVGREALSILLEATPKGIDLQQLAGDMEQLPGIYGVHHVHVWSITNAMPALSCHAITDDMALTQTAPLLTQINTLLHEHYGINHATVQFEGRGLCQHSQECACGTRDECGCSADPAQRLITSGHAH